MTRFARWIRAAYHGCVGSWVRGNGQYDLALHHYLETVSIFPKSAWLWYCLGLFYSDEGWPGHSREEALSCLRKAVDLSPKKRLYREILFYHLLSYQEYEEAAAEVERLRRVMPKLADKFAASLTDSRFPPTWRE